AYRACWLLYLLLSGIVRKSNSRSNVRIRPVRTLNGRKLKAALLFGDVVGEIELEDDAVALKLGGQRGERVGGADGGDGGLVEGVGAGLKGPGHLADVAALGDGKQQSDLAVPAQLHALRHDGEPVAANGGEDLYQVGVEVHAHGVALQFQRAGLAP